MIGALLSGLGDAAVWVWQSAPVPVTLILLAWLCGMVAVLLVPRDAGPGLAWSLAGAAGFLPARDDRRDVEHMRPTAGDSAADVVWLDDRPFDGTACRSPTPEVIGDKLPQTP